MNKPLLSEVCERTYIVAYKEDTSLLEAALRNEGFTVSVLRPSYSQSELKFNSNIRCMLNHRNALAKVVSDEKTGIICEADFVPCVGMGREPYPIPAHLENTASAWLYSNRPVITGEVFTNTFEGFSNALVCYVATPASARVALRFIEETLSSHDPHEYCEFDNILPKFLVRNGIRQLISTRSLGEHGGITSPVHKDIKFGTPNHQAEVLTGPLHFLPHYARGSRIRFRFFRFRFKLRAVVRVFGFRFARNSFLASRKNLGARLSILGFGFRRLGSIH